MSLLAISEAILQIIVLTIWRCKMRLHLCTLLEGVHGFSGTVETDRNELKRRQSSDMGIDAQRPVLTRCLQPKQHVDFTGTNPSDSLAEDLKGFASAISQAGQRFAVDQANYAATLTQTQTPSTGASAKASQTDSQVKQPEKADPVKSETSLNGDATQGSSKTTSRDTQKPAQETHRNGLTEDTMLLDGGASEVTDGDVLPDKPDDNEVVTGALHEGTPCKSVYEVLMHEGLYSFLDELKVAPHVCRLAQCVCDQCLYTASVPQ